MTYNPDELEQYNGDYEDAPEPESDGFRDVPVGKYQAYVERAYIEPPGQYSDHPRLKLQCKIISGKYGGCTLFPSGSFDPKYIQYLKGLIVKMGLGDQVRYASDIARNLDAMLDRILEVAVVARKSDPTKVNYYVNRYIRMMDEPSDEPPPHSDSDDPTGRW